MPHSKLTDELFSVLVRMSQFCRKQNPGAREQTGDMAVFGLLFRQMHESGQIRVRMTEISRYLMISKPAATQAVQHLVESGLVERVNDEEDRRVVYVQATRKGRALFTEGLERGLDTTDRVMMRMGEADADQLVRLMNRFLDIMIEETKQAEEK